MLFQYTMAALFNDFRYAPNSNRGAPLSYIRTVDVNRYKVTAPNLDEIKTVTSALADCSFVGVATSADVLQLLNVMQLVVQFTLHSQRLMRDKLGALQHQSGTDRAAASLVGSLEARNRELLAAVEVLQSEKRSLGSRGSVLEAECTALQSKVQGLERDLRQEKHLRLMATADARAAIECSQQRDSGAHISPRDANPGCTHGCHCDHRRSNRGPRTPRRSRRHHRRQHSSSSSSSTPSRDRKRSSRPRHFVDPAGYPMMGYSHPAPVHITPAIHKEPAPPNPTEQALLQALQRLESDNQSLKRSLELLQKEQEVCYKHVLKVSADQDAMRARSLQVATAPPPAVLTDPLEQPGDLVVSRQLSVMSRHSDNQRRAFTGERQFSAESSLRADNRGTVTHTYTGSNLPQTFDEPLESARSRSSIPASRVEVQSARMTPVDSSFNPLQQFPPAQVESVRRVSVEGSKRGSVVDMDHNGGRKDSHPVPLSTELSPMEEYLRLKQQRANASGVERVGSVVASTVKRYDSLVHSDDDLTPTKFQTDARGSPSTTDEGQGIAPLHSSAGRLPASKPPTANQSRKDSVVDDSESAANRFLSSLSKPRSGVEKFRNVSTPREAPLKDPPKAEKARTPSPSPTSSRSSSSSKASESHGSRSSFKPGVMARQVTSPSTPSSKSSKGNNESTLVSPVKEVPATGLSFKAASTIDSPLTKGGNMFEFKRESSGMMDASATSSVLRRPTSKLLQETQSELQRLLEEEAEAEARKAAMSKSQLD